ncbi:MAG: TonB-dependent receptor [Pseudomonadaceae bacterium]|nr:TonB-dependent receptor [Pseudomonadaceae bacterium]
MRRQSESTAPPSLFGAAATLVVTCALIVVPVTADDSLFVEEITIVGDREQGEQVPGSAHYLGKQELERLGYSDIQRVIRQIPGVSVQVEDGYGLRPNLSIRGVATERSGRITLLEDNVLIAPAPYSAPSAYYFPTLGRMSGVEVLKGPAAITQGPYTIGGALNMLSTPIPTEASGEVLLEAAEDSTYRLHGHFGQTFGNGFGFLLETHQWRSDGFQTIDRGGDSGLDVRDYTLKLAYAPAESRHRIELKWQVADQDSDQSYLGLTDADFSDNGLRRYGLSALDNIDTAHDQIIVRYEFALNDSSALSLTGYRNEHERDWFKTEGIDFDGSANAESFSRTSWSNVIQAVNGGASLGGFTSLELAQILDGSLDTAPGSIQLRSNAREYLSQGIQLGFTWDFETGALRHEFSAGIRWHEDEEDRLQRNSSYSQIDGELVLDDLGLLGNAGNRLQEAEALAIHVFDRIEVGNWVFTPGVRFEDIEQQRTRWETRSSVTSDPSQRTAASVRDRRSNDTTVVLPGFGAAYQVTDSLSLFGGVHKGFTAPSNSPGVKEEEAINYELGVRLSHGELYAEAAYFLSDYDNLLGECTASSGSDCDIGDAFNGDAATVKGVELLVTADLSQGAGISIPASLAYTYIDGSFDTDIADTAFFGDVSSGDPIPYIPEHQLSLTVGLETERWGVFGALSFVDEVCVRASCSDFEQTDSSMTLDISSRYSLRDGVTLLARIENLTDEEDILGRQPYGARPNKSRTASLGVRVEF